MYTQILGHINARLPAHTPLNLTGVSLHENVKFSGDDKFSRFAQMFLNVSRPTNSSNSQALQHVLRYYEDDFKLLKFPPLHTNSSSNSSSSSR